jgi:hypothetical protein
MSNKADRSIHRDPMREIDVMLLDSLAKQDDGDRGTRPSHEGVWIIAALLGLLLALACTALVVQDSTRSDVHVPSLGLMAIP